MRYLVSTTILAVFLTLAGPVQAQAPDTLWSATVPYQPGCVPSGVTELSDGSFFVCGYTATASLNAIDYFIARVSATGALMWSQNFGGDSSESGYAAVQISPDSIIMVGFGYNGRALTLKGLSDGGIVRWSHDYWSGGLTKGYDIKLLPDGNLGVLGYRLGSANSSDAWLLKCTRMGDTLWTRNYGGALIDVGSRFIPLDNGQLVLSCNTRSYGAGDYDFWLLSTDAQGNVGINQTYGTARGEICSGMDRNDMGEVFISGRSSTADSNIAYVVKARADGSQAWARTYSIGMAEGQARGVAIRDGGGALWCGWQGYTFDDSQFWMMSVDSSGTQEWSWVYGPGGSRLYGIIPVSAGGWLAYGLLPESGTQSPRTYLLRIKPPAGLRGTVHEVGSDNPVVGAAITALGRNRTAYSDALGHYSLELLPGVVDLAIGGRCTSRDTVRNVTILPDSVSVFDLTAGIPYYHLGLTSLNVEVHNHMAHAEPVVLQNYGSGTMRYSVSVHTIQPATAWLWPSPAEGLVPPGEESTVNMNILADTSNNGTYDYYAEMTVHTNSCPDTSTTIPVLVSVLDVDRQLGVLPTEYALHPVFPNPFNGQARVQFDLPHRGAIRLSLYDVTGRVVAVLADGVFEAGSFSASVDGSRMPSGVYFARLTAKDFAAVQKMTIVK